MSTNTLVGFADLHHTGIIVDEVEAAMAEHSDLMGVTWGAQGSTEIPIPMPAGSSGIVIHQARSGVSIESVDVALRAVMVQGDE